jgi:hypothetical protein
MDTSLPAERNPHTHPHRPTIDREKLPAELGEKREVDRKNNPNLILERHLKKRLPPPLKKDQNKDVTQKPKHFGRKEEVTPKQDEPRPSEPVKHKLADRSKDISPHPNTIDYHTVSISQRNKQSKDNSAHVTEGAYKKDDRDTRMRKKMRVEYEKPAGEQQTVGVTSLKKQASPSG